jgi:hypothetical protein
LGFSSLLGQLDALLLRNLKFEMFRVPSIQGLTKNGETRVLLSEFHHTTNLMTFCLIIWGPRKNSKAIFQTNVRNMREILENIKKLLYALTKIL